MKIIKEEKINKEISKEWQYDFRVEETGIYLIEITARAKSWWQNLRNLKSFFYDDDLIITIDNFSFPKLNNKKGLFDSEMSWNGNQLKGLLKTNLYVLYFEKGEHNINFKNDQNPFLENISMFQIENEFTYVSLKNNIAENGDRRPWFALALAGFSIGKLKINISAGKNDKKDDEDAKLIIDGKIQENSTEKSHKNWYWCGKIFKGEEKGFDKDLKLEKGVHYIELYADGSPTLNKIEVEISRKNLGEIPTVDNPKWTGDFNDDTDEIILARLIFGEARGEPREAKEWVAWSVINRIEAKSWWPKTIHGVILQKYQYDPIKPTDKNYLKIIDPLGFVGSDKISRASWRECYKIAEDVISRKTINPTKATHFHGAGVTKKWYEKNIVPHGKFIKKIGNTYFYWSPN
jgi:hypothetical protein